ncbi:MAG: polysaccharide deacetylase family protein [Candidatus Eisenbacteria bacterium]|nr:polysaccharide deacetylase family protein [Candidatus Eisenbacteria bacterium]
MNKSNVRTWGFLLFLLLPLLLLVLPLHASAGPRASAAPHASAAPRVRVRCSGEAFEVLEQGRWKPLFFKGVNLGSAPPGKFPGEFAISKKQYVHWLDEVSELGANAIRVYTLHPPALYEALLEHNGRADSRKIWLFQGAWFELPASLDLYDGPFSDEFRAEIRSVVDALHGSVSLPERRGHAWGEYAADVSDWVAGYVLGRECEPYAVLNTDKLHSDVARFSGRCLGVKKGSPTECWFAGMCDFLATYERDKFGWEHPVSFTNWPTLDPIKHPTETERGGARAYHDEDAASVDPSVIRPSKEFEAGFFATFHAYPYYPDFMNLDPGYSTYADEHGFCNYAGYLRDLKAHLRGMPLLVGETGISTSRGVAHFQPQGLNHGGASEKVQGLQDTRLLEDCYREGAAGVLVFELFDEWFKDNWLVKDFEVPADRDILWQNVQDPEEFFGLLAEEPAVRNEGAPQGKAEQRQQSAVDEKPVRQSDSSFVDWSRVEAFYVDREGDSLYLPCRDLTELRVSSDSRYIYLRIAFSSLDCDHDGKADLDSLDLLVGFDTIDRRRGDARFPFVRNVTTEAGMEFVLHISGADSAVVLIDSGYNFSRYSRVPSDGGFSTYLAPFRSKANSDGKFERMIVETNRDRVDANGRVYPAIDLDVGRLASAKEAGRADVAVGDWRIHTEENYIEARIPWAILNVTDPSSRQVLDDVAGTPEMESSETDGIVLSVLSLVPGEAESQGAPTVEREATGDLVSWGAPGESAVACDAMPEVVAGDASEGAPEGTQGDGGYKFSLTNLKAFVWQKWDTASYVERRKASFEILSSGFSSLPDSPLASVRARVATWPDDKDAAISVSFDDGTANQVDYALPILESLGIKATFGLCASWTGETRKTLELSKGCVRTQLSIGDARRLVRLDHEIASHGFRHVFLDTLSGLALDHELKDSKSFLERALGENVSVLHYPFSRVNDRVKEAARRAGYTAARGRGLINSATPDEFLLQSVSIVSDTLPSSGRLAELLTELKRNKGWLIFTYHNVLPSASPEAGCYRKLSSDEPYYVTQAAFRRQMEELKATGFYMARESDVLKYIRARDNVKLIVREEKDKAVIKVQMLSADISYEKGISLILNLPWEKVRVQGSLSDSHYAVHGGRLAVKAAVGSEVTVYREN